MPENRLLSQRATPLPEAQNMGTMVPEPETQSMVFKIPYESYASIFPRTLS